MCLWCGEHLRGCLDHTYPLSFTLLFGVSDIPWALAWHCKLSFLFSGRHLRSDRSQTFSEKLNLQLTSQFENLELCSSLSISHGLPKYLCFNHWGRMISDRSTLSSPGLCLLGALNHLCPQPSKMQIFYPWDIQTYCRRTYSLFSPMDLKLTLCLCSVSDEFERS